jgi:hypothetical protein
VAAAAGVTVATTHLAALEAARSFRLARHAVSAEQIGRLRRDLPLPHLLVPALDADSIGPAQTQQLAAALAEAVSMLVAEGAA